MTVSDVRRLRASAANQPAAPRCPIFSASAGLVGDDCEVHPNRSQHDDEGHRRDVKGRRPSGEMVERIPDDFDNDEQQEQNHRTCSATVSYFRCPYG